MADAGHMALAGSRLMIRLTIVTLYVVCAASPRAQGLLLNGENQTRCRQAFARAGDRRARCGRARRDGGEHSDRRGRANGSVSI
jgi:hypothetical protein